MEKFGLLVNNNKYATFKDSNNFLYPASRVEEYEIKDFGLTANAPLNMTLTGLSSPLRIDEFFFYSSQGTGGKSITITVKKLFNAEILKASFPSNIIVPSVPKMVLEEGYTLSFLSQVNVENVRLQFTKVAIYLPPVPPSIPLNSSPST